MTLNYDNLPLDTKLRFLEIELSAGVNTLTTLLGTPQRAQESLIRSLAQSDHELYLTLTNLFNSRRFLQPTREELIQYFRYKGIGVQAVTRYAKASPNTVVGYKDKYPNFTPVFPGWKEHQHAIMEWDQLKTHLNLFNDDLIHTKNNYQIYF